MWTWPPSNWMWMPESLPTSMGMYYSNMKTEDVFVDEGFIVLSGSEAFPAYLIAGRQYIPFGDFDSHFVTDPSTLILGRPMRDLWWPVIGSAVK